MKVLGIETSCDETAVAVVEDGRRVLCNFVASQEKYHRKFYGIVPEIASRKHVEVINILLERALRKVGGDIDAVAVTIGPGLVGSLFIGAIVGETLSCIKRKPFIPVNHLEGHIFANFLVWPEEELSPPFLALIVSGGHTELVLSEKFCSYEVLGRTRDDACGEVLDKVAKFLSLGYPGGPVIDKLLRNAPVIVEDSEATFLPYPFPSKESYDFSFSGIKTAVIYYVEKNYSRKNGKFNIPKKELLRLLYVFQRNVMKVLVDKTMAAARRMRVKKVLLGGGVSANSFLRKMILEEAAKEDIRVYCPPVALCTDNASMVASCGYYRMKYLGRKYSYLFEGKVLPELTL
jgi:N6-L-threonylcarbamoyladenine synthase